MTKEKIAEILRKHIAWLLNEDDGERADLGRADLRGAALDRADLRSAALDHADLSGALLRGASLDDASLDGASLDGADLRGVPLEMITKLFPLACPESGAFIGWKKCGSNMIVKLQIPEDARRSSAFGRKCRCDKAVVLGIEDICGNPVKCEYVTSSHDSSFLYHVGETVSVENFDTNRTHECAPGIHFFITRQEAVDY